MPRQRGCLLEPRYARNSRSEESLVSLRTVERATLRFETGPGQQLQVDFGECWLEVAGERVKVFVFVGTRDCIRWKIFEHLMFCGKMSTSNGSPKRKSWREAEVVSVGLNGRVPWSLSVDSCGETRATFGRPRVSQEQSSVPGSGDSSPPSGGGRKVLPRKVTET